MLNINYALIGTIPEMEMYRNSLPALIAEFRAEKQKVGEKEPFSVMAKGAAIEMCAAHFYGLEVRDFSTMAELIDAIESMDQALEFQ